MRFLRVFCVVILTACVITAEPSTNNCGTEFGCFRDPAGCQNADCRFIYKWQNDGDSTKFYLSVKGTLKNLAWISIGFSYDTSMGDDSIVVCKDRAPARSSVEAYFTTGKVPPTALDDRVLGLSNEAISVNDGFFHCNFTRKKIAQTTQPYFDLSSSKRYHLLAAFGPLDQTDGATVRYHGPVNRIASAESIDFTRNDDKSGGSKQEKAKAHACLMIVAWIFVATNGILFARYFKHLLPNFKPCGIQFWFHVHRPLMVLVLALNVAAFILILSENNWKWVAQSQTIGFTHSIFGILTISFTVIQVFLGVIRCDKDSPKRFLFNYSHRGLGMLTFIFSTVTLFLGMFIEKMSLKKVGWSILIGWVVWIVCLILQLEFAAFFTRKIAKKEQNQAYEMSKNGTEVKDASATAAQGNQKQLKTINLMKSIMLSAHVLVSLTISITLVVYVATR